MKGSKDFQTLNNYFINSQKVATSRTRGSIDVDHVKVYEIKDASTDRNPRQQPISLQSQGRSLRSLQMYKQMSSRNKSSNPTNNSAMTLPAKIQIIKNNKSLQLLSSSFNSQNQANSISKQIHKSSADKQFFQKVDSFINFFISIKQTKIDKVMISSEEFYNLTQSRKSLSMLMTQYPKFSTLKFLYQMQYTNKLSFLLYLIDKKHQKYGIYMDQVEQILAINQIINNEIQDLINLYLNEQENRYLQTFDQGFLQQINQMNAKFDQYRGINQKQISQQSQLQKIQDQSNIDQNNKENDNIAADYGYFQNNNQSEGYVQGQKIVLENQQYERNQQAKINQSINENQENIQQVLASKQKDQFKNSYEDAAPQQKQNYQVQENIIVNQDGQKHKQISQQEGQLDVSQLSLNTIQQNNKKQQSIQAQLIIKQSAQNQNNYHQQQNKEQQNQQNYQINNSKLNIKQAVRLFKKQQENERGNQEVVETENQQKKQSQSHDQKIIQTQKDFKQLSPNSDPRQYDEMNFSQN